MATLVLESPFPPEECRLRILSAAPRDRLLRVGHSRTETVVVRPTKDGFRLRVHRVRVRNSFAPVLRARLAAHPHGTLIVARIGMYPVVTAFMALWFFLLSLIGGTIVVLSLMNLRTGQPEADGSPIAGLLVPPLMTAFGIGLVLVGRRMAGTDREKMLTFVMQVLHASESSPSRASSLMAGKAGGLR